MLKIFPTVIKVCQVERESEVRTKRILRQLLASWLGKPNANTGVDRGETSVGMALVAAVSDMPNTTSEKMTVCSRHRFA